VTREEIVQFFDRRAACFKALDAASLAALHAEDCLYESPLAGKAIGRPAIEKVYRGLFTSFPDCTLEITDLIIDGDRAVQIAVFSGTDRGGFMNLPPSGRKSSFPIVFSFVFKDGLIERETVVYDFTGWLVQIGVLKAKPQ
jgi:steroid delta-isomerase-like uncharacterized protein